MRILTFSTLFPNREKPNHGVFVETRLRHLVATGQVEARVVAPVPWFPFQHPSWGRYASYARVPMSEERFGISVEHPRYFLPPKIGTNIAPEILFKGSKSCIAKLIDEGFDFDLIDAHYFYPDGVAANKLGRYFNKPVVISARGSDISLLPRYKVPRQKILSAAKDSHGLITVCDALKEALIRLGADAEKITTLRNGVDLQMFHPTDRENTRKNLQLDGFTLLTVGHLVPVKGHELILHAIKFLPGSNLLIIGEGPLRNRLEQLAQQLGVEHQVRFLGAMPQHELRQYYTASDALVLASEREGWANVLLESMACGTPVVASNVWGTPEVVAAPEAGVLMKERTPLALVEAIQTLQNNLPDRSSTRRYAERFSWQATTHGQLQLFTQILQQAA